MPQYPASIELSSLNGSNGFQINVEAPGDRLGLSLASAGDFNGDGLDDMIVGTREAAPDGVYSGAGYIVFGRPGGFGAELNLSSLDGSNGFQINGEAAGGLTAWSVASAGDFNGDGFSDVVIGAPGVEVNGEDSGASYVVFGRAGASPAVMNLSALDGRNGFQINGELWSQNGFSVASAGDLNRDGFDDVILGGYGDFGSPVSWVVYGRSGGFGAEFDVSTLNGTNGFRIDVGASHFNGLSVSSAGDFNGDGLDDLMLGASGVNGLAGVSYVVFGRAEGFSAELRLASLTANQGFRIAGSPGEISGSSVASAGDLNADGFGDLIIGAYGTGDSYVVLGRAGGFAAGLSLSSLDGANGFKLSGGHSGVRVASAGDVNGDGFDDLLIGSPTTPQNGVSYVVFGRAGGFPADLNLTALDGTNGFKIQGEAAGDRSGGAIASAGDVNGDGLDDLMVGAGGSTSAESSIVGGHLVLGRRPDAAVTRTGTDVRQTLVGSDFADTLNGLGGDDRLLGYAGDDTLNGGDGADVTSAGAGRDHVFGGRGSDLIGGGDGDDRLHGEDGDDFIGGEAGGDYIDGGGGRDALFGDGGNDWLIGGADDDRLFGQDGDDLIGGQEGDDFVDGGAGRDQIFGDAGADHMIGGGDNDRIHGQDGDDLIGGQDGDDFVDGGAGRDQLFGDAGGDHLIGGGDNDRLHGQDGDDLIGGQDGDDFIDGGDGRDALYGDGGRDHIVGGVDDDRLHGQDGDDLMGGQDGADYLEGGQGSDQLFGDAGDDFIFGGGDDDRLDGGAGFDTAAFRGARSSYTVTTTGDGSLTVAGADGVDRLVGIERLRFDDGDIGVAPTSAALEDEGAGASADWMDIRGCMAATCREAFDYVG